MMGALLMTGTTVHAQQLGAHAFCFHYRADVPLGLFDPLHLGEVGYGRASAQRVLVFDLPDAHGSGRNGWEKK